MIFFIGTNPFHYTGVKFSKKKSKVKCLIIPYFANVIPSNETLSMILLKELISFHEQCKNCCLLVEIVE